MNLFVLIAEFIESLIGTINALIRTFLIAPSLAYIRIVTAFIWVPEILDFAFYRKIILRHWRVFPATAIVITPLGLVWDSFATTNGIWYFPGTIVGIWFFGMPLEDFLLGIFLSWFVILFYLFFYNLEAKRNVRPS